MKIFIVGLGLMGASYALGLSQKGYEVYGYDSDLNINKKALKDGLIKSFDKNHISTSDVILLALYPTKNIEFIRENIQYFNNQLITDIAGTKVLMMNEIIKILPKNTRYVSHHPMAGKEKSGYDFRDPKMFKGANFLIVPSDQSTIDDVETIKQIAIDLEFGNISIYTPLEHDQFIGYTSQLTHMIAVALMLANKDPNLAYTTGDSFKDLTRIAKINEHMWTELFFQNKEILVNEIDLFIEKLNQLKSMLDSNQYDELKEALKKSKEKRLVFDEISSKKL
ncbi:prephenate dehydrogenase [Acholeplasma equifetale]|uniref:prephenate dehydrogenase n=1 Tax=Acholeplasma equifetale TaxID=264634 RepID=UPI00047DD1CE|nr:prephenate dehydrogenase [Acholeplasma equifetale]